MHILVGERWESEAAAWQKYPLWLEEGGQRGRAGHVYSKGVGICQDRP